MDPITLMLIMAALSGAATYQASSTAKKVAENNAKIAEFSAQDAERRGEKNAQDVRRQADALKARQRVVLASKGLDVGEGTAQDLQDQTDYFSLVDQATARNNARREAWGKRAYGAGYQAQADNARPGFDAAMTFMSKATPVAGKWYSGASAGSATAPIDGSIGGGW